MSLPQPIQQFALHNFHTPGTGKALHRPEHLRQHLPRRRPDLGTQAASEGCVRLRRHSTNQRDGRAGNGDEEGHQETPDGGLHGMSPAQCAVGSQACWRKRGDFQRRRAVQSKVQLPADLSPGRRSDHGGEATWGGMAHLGCCELFLARTWVSSFVARSA